VQLGWSAGREGEISCWAVRMGLLAEGSCSRRLKGILRVRVCHESGAVFDDPNLVSCAGSAPVLTLAERAGLHELLAEHLTLTGRGRPTPR